jgi:hypothetical protein
VTNRSTGEQFVTPCRLPVQIGRQSGVGSQVLLDSSYRGVSRIHGTIEQTSRGDVYSDTSTYGSRVGGLLVHGSKMALSGRFSIEIDQFTITRIEIQTPIVVVHTDGQLNQLAQIELLPGRGLGILAPAQSPRLVDLNRWEHWDKPLLGRIEIADAQPFFARGDHTDIEVKKNRTPIKQDRVLLSPLDVLVVQGHRFEILHPHEGRVVCGNKECHMLNKPPLAGNCRYCGRDLAGTGGFSRIVQL